VFRWRWFVHDMAEVVTIQPRRNQNADRSTIIGTNQ
jgi:hypothetical protein